MMVHVGLKNIFTGSVFLLVTLYLFKLSGKVNLFNKLGSRLIICPCRYTILMVDAYMCERNVAYIILSIYQMQTIYNQMYVVGGIIMSAEYSWKTTLDSFHMLSV